MKALALAVLALVIVHQTMHRQPPQRTPAQQRAWAGWFDLHKDGGAV